MPLASGPAWWPARSRPGAPAGSPRPSWASPTTWRPTSTSRSPAAPRPSDSSRDRILDEAKLRLHAEERELEQLAALDARYVLLDERSINHSGIADLVIRGDWADLSAFDDAAGAVAAALGRDGCPESLDVRRSMAVGILADPERAQALLTASPTSRPRPKRTILLAYHLTDAALVGAEPAGFDVDGRPLLDQLVRQWCGRDDVPLVVQPLLTLGACNGADRHDGHATGDYRRPLTTIGVGSRAAGQPGLELTTTSTDRRGRAEPD